MNPQNALATLCQITTLSIKNSYKFFPKVPLFAIIVGGGNHNKHLLNTLKNQLSSNVLSAEDVNLATDYLEAELVAFLAARLLNRLPTTFPSTTGVRNPNIGGEIVISI